MELFLLVAICSLLTASSNAQICGSITGPELGPTVSPASTGLIADILGEAVQLLRFRIVCEVTAGNRDSYTQVSVVAEYLRGSSTNATQAQLEFSCVADEQWASVSNQSFTTPPNIDNILFAVRRRDCYRCVNPNEFGSSAPGNNHCLGCSSACMGLDQCTTSNSPSDCCNYYNPDGSCTLSCQAPFQPLPDKTCGCPSGFTGPLCDILTCSQNPCMNSGSCFSTSSGFSCACPAEYTGVMCEIPLNPCMSTPCANGGTCTPLAGTGGDFECNCPTGFEGNTCQNNINECVATPSPCLNGGTCTDSFGNYTCNCQGQWEGQNCEVCGIINCTGCSTDGTSCMQCVGGFFVNSENTCSLIPVPVVQCTLESCGTCSTDNLVCEQCESGFIVGLNRLCVRGTPRDINLDDIEIIAIVVGCLIGFILIVALLACCLTWTFKSVFKKGPQYIKKQKKKIVRKSKSHSKVQQATMVNEDMEVGVDENERYENTYTEGPGDLTLF